MTKILIVEDEAGLRQGLEINLRLENYETALAGDGEEAIRVFHEESPDLVLLDLMLPKKSGFEVLDHIRKFSKIPVILLTARGQETDKVRGLRGGAVELCPEGGAGCVAHCEQGRDSHRLGG